MDLSKAYECLPHDPLISRGGVDLYIKDTLSKKERPYIAILPECIVCELHFDGRSTFSLFCIETQVRESLNLTTS